MTSTRDRNPKKDSFKVLIERMADFVTDPRLPQGGFNAGWRWLRFGRRDFRDAPTNQTRTISVALTFDVEDNYRNAGVCTVSKEWLPKFIDWAGNRKATLYVQASTVRTLRDELHVAQSQHELGLHGLYHEVWGNAKWWQYSLGYPSLPLSEKERRLRESLQIIEESDLRRPKSFRAPYLNIDRPTLRTLFNYGFTSDSSAAAYYGDLPVRARIGQVLQIPVTAVAVPHVKIRGIAWFSFSQLILPTLVDSTEDSLRKMIRSAVDVQESLGIPPHVVFLAHPWEFYPLAGLAHSGPNNWKHLERFLDLLGSDWNVEYSTISDIEQMIRVACGLGHSSSVSTLVNMQGATDE